MTNIQVLTVSYNHNISALSSEPCSTEGDVLAWHPGDWRVEGDRWLLVEETGDSVCDQGNSYTIAIPVEMAIQEAIDICRNKLNKSILPYHEDQDSLHSYTSWYLNITGGLCHSVWTPFSDVKTEGLFLNINDGSEARYLPWEAAQPNGGSDENYVRIMLRMSLYRAVPLDSPQICTSCLLDRSLLLRLDGLCEDSYIGEFKV